MEGITRASFASLFGLLIAIIPAIAGLWFAFRPGERLLSIMRPLTLAAVFAALCSFTLALTNGFASMSRLEVLDLNGVRLLGAVMMEGLAPVVASFVSLTFAWACVAIGMRRV
jgi:hypothetical protein